MKKLFVMLLSLILVVSAVSGCTSKKVSEEKVLRFNINADPRSIDPQLNISNDGSDVITNTFEGLYREIGGELVPGVAKKHKVSEDGLVYTFYLRDSKWSDGKPVTAKDFEYAWKRAADPTTASEYAYIMDFIKNAHAVNAGEKPIDEMGVKALDDKTLEVTLETPADYFLSLTQFFTYMPVREDAVAKGADGAWAKNPESAISNGPFKVSSYATGDKLILVKNENYWQADKVKLDKIECSFIEEASTYYTAYESGDLDVVLKLPQNEVPKLSAESDEFYIDPAISTYYYDLNMTKEPFNDVKVRKALAYAIDRTSIVKDVTKAGQLPAISLTPPGLKDSDGKDFNKTAEDYGIPVDGSKVEEAKKLLSEAGYPEGKGFPKFKIKYNTDDGHKAVAEAIQEMWKTNLGIECELQNMEFAVLQTERSAGNFDVARDGWIGDYTDPLTMINLWTKGNPMNYPKFENKEYDELIKVASSTMGKEHFDALYAAEKILMENMPVIPIYYYTDDMMIKKNVTGWERTTQNNHWFGFADIK